MTFAPSGTDVGGAGQANTNLTFQDFQSSAGYTAGDILNSVTLEISLGVNVTALSFTNTTGATQNSTYFTQTTVGVTGTAPAGDITLLDDGNFPTGGLANALNSPSNGVHNLYTVGNGSNEQSVCNGQTITYLPAGSAGVTGTATLNGCNSVVGTTTGTGSYLYDSGVVTSTNPGAYNTSGTFGIAYNTFTQTGATDGGANLTTQQVTTTSDLVTVIYNYSLPSSTPEPATMVLFGSALVGLGFIRRRQKKV
jgi:hypothetical protein